MLILSQPNPNQLSITEATVPAYLEEAFVTAPLLQNSTMSPWHRCIGARKWLGLGHPLGILLLIIKNISIPIFNRSDYQTI